MPGVDEGCTYVRFFHDLFVDGILRLGLSSTQTAM